MEVFKEKECNGAKFVDPQNKDLPVQLVLSSVLGLTAFVAFCVLRPRWPSLYAARKRRLDATIGLPSLPDSFFGWIPGVWKVTEEQVLASAGLDAFVFLRFFKLSIRLFSVLWLFAVVVLLPINEKFSGKDSLGNKKPKDNSTTEAVPYLSFDASTPEDVLTTMRFGHKYAGPSYLIAYFVFTYFFTALTLYYINWETFKVIRIRQDYLGTQSTITDRTFRLSGLPNDLRSEDQIERLIEKLEIGKVESVTLCRNWSAVDKLMEQRKTLLRKLEGVWSDYLKKQQTAAKAQGSQEHIARRVSDSTEDGQNLDNPDEENGENGRLLNGDQGQVEAPRPQRRIWSGFPKLKSRLTDAIDYYEEKLRRLDEKIAVARDSDYQPGTMAFVTMDSIAACQMAIQARIDPRPGQLLAKPAPAPSDVVWKNTYSPRGIRRLKSWTVTIFVTVLSFLFLFPVLALAGLLNICTIERVLPHFAEWLNDRQIIKSLVQTGLPTLTVSLLNIAVPFLYDFLSNRQGLISQGDVELAVISKNFFFTFFNIFLVFTVSGTATGFWAELQGALKDTTSIPTRIAQFIQDFGQFYANFILLQGVGLMPFRLLEIGSVALYPFMRMASKTPRDFAELRQPPVFQYGFYLPTALLVFILCITYSVLPMGFLVLTFGILYFTLGYVTYKYQLLYAMDQPQHATGGAWRLICYRIILGVVVFHITMIGILALSHAYIEAILISPLLIFTVWYSYYFRQRFEPLTKFISLRSIRIEIDEEDAAAIDENFETPRASQGLLRRGSTIDEDKEKGLKFVNPSLTAPLQKPWIYDDPPPSLPADVSSSASQQPVAVHSSDSSFSLGDTHVWRDGAQNV